MRFLLSCFVMILPLTSSAQFKTGRDACAKYRDQPLAMSAIRTITEADVCRSLSVSVTPAGVTNGPNGSPLYLVSTVFVDMCSYLVDPLKKEVLERDCYVMDDPFRSMKRRCEENPNLPYCA